MARNDVMLHLTERQAWTVYTALCIAGLYHRKVGNEELVTRFNQAAGKVAGALDHELEDSDA